MHKNWLNIQCKHLPKAKPQNFSGLVGPCWWQ